MTWQPGRQGVAATSPVSDESPSVFEPRAFEHARVLTFGILMVMVDRHDKFIGLALVTEGRLRVVTTADERRMQDNGAVRRAS